MAKKAKKRVVRKARKEVILPKKLSSLIKIALRDMRKAEKASDKYLINMGDWYTPGTEITCQTGSGYVVKSYKVCSLCAAGSVMAFSLANESQKKGMLIPQNFSKNSRQLEAINYLRSGSVVSAGAYLGIQRDNLDKFETEIPEYDVADPEPFHKAMGKLQERLQKAGY